MVKNFKNILQDFAGDTTAHGLGRVSTAKPIWLKVAWLLAFLCGVGVLTWQLVGIFQEYYKYPITVKTTIKDGNVKFPAVSFCNLNPIRQSMLSIGGLELSDTIEQYINAVNSQLSGKTSNIQMRKKREVRNDDNIYRTDQNNNHGNFNNLGSISKNMPQDIIIKHHRVKRSVNTATTQNTTSTTSATPTLPDTNTAPVTTTVPDANTTTDDTNTTTHDTNTTTPNTTTTLPDTTTAPVTTIVPDTNTTTHDTNTTTPNTTTTLPDTTTAPVTTIVPDTNTTTPDTNTTTPDTTTTSPDTTTAPVTTIVPDTNTTTPDTNTTTPDTTTTLPDTTTAPVTTIVPDTNTTTPDTNTTTPDTTTTLPDTNTTLPDTTKAPVTTTVPDTNTTTPDTTTTTPDTTTTTPDTTTTLPDTNTTLPDTTTAPVTTTVPDTNTTTPDTTTTTPDTTTTTPDTTTTSPDTTTTLPDTNTTTPDTTTTTPDTTATTPVTTTPPDTTTTTAPDTTTTTPDTTTTTAPTTSPPDTASTNTTKTSDTTTTYAATSTPRTSMTTTRTIFIAKTTSPPTFDVADQVYTPDVNISTMPWFANTQGNTSATVSSGVTLTKVLNNISITDRRSMGYQIQDMLVECLWDGQVCTPLNFTGFYDKTYGNCFTFNSAYTSPILFSEKPGSIYGLGMTLFIDQSNFIQSVSPAVGVRLVIHNQDYQPFPKDDGFTVIPGQKTSVQVRRIHMEHLPSPYGDCTEDGETNVSLLYNKSYSQLACLKSCYQSQTVNMCKCAQPELSVPAGWNSCQASDIGCMQTIQQMISNNTLPCDCPILCHEDIYYSSLSTSMWPGSKTVFSLQEILSERGPAMREAVKNISTISENFLRIEVYYNVLREETVIQRPAITAMMLLSNVGGTMGLWVGFSFLTLLEVIQLVAEVCAHFCNKKKITKLMPYERDVETGAG